MNYSLVKSYSLVKIEGNLRKVLLRRLRGRALSLAMGRFSGEKYIFIPEDQKNLNLSN